MTPFQCNLIIIYPVWFNNCVKVNMPEGPSIVILKEAVQKFEGRKVLVATGNSKQDIGRINGKKVIAFKTWGKHFIIKFSTFSVRIHFMLFGSYRIDDPKDSKPRLSLEFTNGRIDFYACSVKLIEDPLDQIYDWSADVLSETWDPKAAKAKLKRHSQDLVCDALLNQEIFAGVGNIIKNEVLFRIGVNPNSIVGFLPAAKLSAMIREARNYSFDFLEWKKQYVLKKHWKVHTKKICPKCGGMIIKKHLGKTNRRTFFCEKDQKLYTPNSQ